MSLNFGESIYSECEQLALSIAYEFVQKKNVQNCCNLFEMPEIKYFRMAAEAIVSFSNQDIFDRLFFF